MWTLKYEYAHGDCKYSPLVKKYHLTFLWYPLNAYIKGKYRYMSSLHILQGKNHSIQRYMKYLERIAFKSERITQNTLFYLTRASALNPYYEYLYNPKIFYTSPIIHREGMEYGSLASWDRKPLGDLALFMKNNPSTSHFKLISLKEERMDELFLMKAIQKTTPKQRELFQLAIQKGYYHYPRNIDLNGLAKQSSIKKSAAHEILRRAEANILPQL